MSTLVVPRPASQAPHALTETSSFLLDIIRFSAAILVVVSHSGHPEFHTGFQNRQILGDFAVPVFFVLSGFVIRFVTRSREHTLRNFFIDRAARMYSVMLPAMAFTLFIAGLCIFIDRPYYMQMWGAYSDHILTRVLLNLTFLSQSWGHTTIPLIDSPFWSLSYECMYYIAYGLLFYMRGYKRILAILLWALVAGPQIIFLLPVWWLGCWVYDLYYALRTRSVARLIRGATLVYLILGVALFAVGQHALLAAPLHLDLAFSSLPNPIALAHIPERRATMMATGTGLLAGILMLLTLLLSDLLTLPKHNVWIRRFRHVADGTFAIYLFHYPLLALATIIGLLAPHRWLLNITTTTVIVILLIFLARPLDLFKVSLRNQLRRLIPAA